MFHFSQFSDILCTKDLMINQQNNLQIKMKIIIICSPRPTTVCLPTDLIPSSSYWYVFGTTGLNTSWNELQWRTKWNGYEQLIKDRCNLLQRKDIVHIISYFFQISTVMGFNTPMLYMFKANKKIQLCQFNLDLFIFSQICQTMFSDWH